MAVAVVAVVEIEVVAAAVVAVVVFVYDPPEALVALEVAFEVVVPAATDVVPAVVVVVVAGRWTGCDSVCDAERGRGGECRQRGGWCGGAGEVGGEGAVGGHELWPWLC